MKLSETLLADGYIMNYEEEAVPQLGALPSGHIHRTSAMQVAIMSNDTTFSSDDDTEFAASVPEAETVPNQELPAGTINISDSALGAVVINSEGTRIDTSGTKTDIKIERAGDGRTGGTCQPESDATPWYDTMPRPETGVNANNSVLLNTVVGSSDTKINMTGAKIKIKRKKKDKTSRKAPQAGHINVDNSVALNLVANSRDTCVVMKDADINIE